MTKKIIPQECPSRRCQTYKKYLRKALITILVMDLAQEKAGDPKTLTPGPWTPLRTGSMDYLADRSADPLYGPPLKRIKK